MEEKREAVRSSYTIYKYYIYIYRAFRCYCSNDRLRLQNYSLISRFFPPHQICHHIRFRAPLCCCCCSSSIVSTYSSCFHPILLLGRQLIFPLPAYSLMHTLDSRGTEQCTVSQTFLAFYRICSYVLGRYLPSQFQYYFLNIPGSSP